MLLLEANPDNEAVLHLQVWALLEPQCSLSDIKDWVWGTHCEMHIKREELSLDRKVHATLLIA